MSAARTIDVHTHILTQETAALLRKAAPKVPVTITPIDAAAATVDVGGNAYRPFPTGGFDIAHRLRDMDAGGVDVQVLSAAPQTYLYDQEAALCAATSAVQNDQIAKHIADYPERFWGIATLPMQAPERAADELTRAMRKLGLRGAMIGSNVMGKNLDDPNLEPLWAAAEELGAFMFVHPVNVAGSDRLSSYYLRNLVGNPLDTTIAAACSHFRRGDGSSSQAQDLPRACRRLHALSGGALGSRLARAAGAKEKYAGGAGDHHRPFSLRHHRAFRSVAGVFDRTGGR